MYQENPKKIRDKPTGQRAPKSAICSRLKIGGGGVDETPDSVWCPAQERVRSRTRGYTGRQTMGGREEKAERCAFQLMKTLYLRA